MVENGSLARSLSKLGPLAIQKIKIYIFNKCAIDTLIMAAWLMVFARLSDLLLFVYIVFDVFCARFFFFYSFSSGNIACFNYILAVFLCSEISSERMT